MNLQQLRDQLPEYAKDTKLNLGSLILNNESADLSPAQIAGIALACAYSTRQSTVITALYEHAKTLLDETSINAAKAAATIMAMNNVYYRFTHLVSDPDYRKMPAKLRMNVIGNPGIEKVDFELFSLAISAINGCGMCMDSHAATLQKNGMSKEAIQTCIRIAAVVNALAQVLTIESVQ